MPEGDTIKTIASLMSPRLVGTKVELVEMDHVERPLLRERVVESVEARGKHLLIGLGDLYLRAHLGLHGSWHRYPKGARWKRPQWQASLVLRTNTDTFVCFNAGEVDCVSASRLALHRPLKRLGQDLLGERVDFHAIVARARSLMPHAPLATVLLDQRVAAGIGNVYKSEVLYLTGRHPATRLSDIDDEALVAIYREAQAQLRANVGVARRSTTGTSPRLWVYRRSGQPCLRCASVIAFARTGRGRSTYWCSRCQPPVASGSV